LGDACHPEAVVHFRHVVEADRSSVDEGLAVLLDSGLNRPRLLVSWNSAFHRLARGMDYL
jgi:hypothetical protein